MHKGRKPNHTRSGIMEMDRPIAKHGYCYLIEERPSGMIYIGQCIDANEALAHMHVATVIEDGPVQWEVRHARLTEIKTRVFFGAPCWIAIDSPVPDLDDCPVVHIDDDGSVGLTTDGMRFVSRRVI
jgi:hypothetical protein